MLVMIILLQVAINSCETCGGNPCLNNGVCQEAYTDVGHKCICPAGFSGGLCENTGETCYPGEETFSFSLSISPWFILFMKDVHGGGGKPFFIFMSKVSLNQNQGKIIPFYSKLVPLFKWALQKVCIYHWCNLDCVYRVCG